MPFPPYPPVPAPTTWAAGPVTTNELTTDVTNGVEFLANRPLFVGLSTTPVSVPNVTTTVVPLPTELIDTWGGHQPNVDNTRYLCQAPGWHLVAGWIPYASPGTGFYSAYIQYKNGVSGATTLLGGEQLPYTSTYPIAGAYCCDLVNMSAGGTPDSVQWYTRQSSGATVSLFSTSGQQPWTSARWVCAQSGTTGLPVPASPAWPTPPSFITSAFLNSNIRDALRFLAYPPIFRGYLAGSSLTMASVTWPASVTIALDTTSGAGTTAGGPPVDNYSGWQASSHNWKAPVAGLYTLFGEVAAAMNTSAASQFAAGVAINGTVTWGSRGNLTASSVNCVTTVKTMARLNAGDTVALVGSQDSGATQPLVGSAGGNQFCKLIAVWEAA